MDSLSAIASPELLQQGVAILMGLALAATCGLRAFLPLFTLSVLAHFGKVELGESFLWLASPGAMLCFGVAVVVELVGDKIPAVDHALDALGVVVKPAAATVATASVVTHFDPMIAIVLGLMTGGLAAEGVHLTKAKARLMSSALTGTIANPVLSVLEDIAAFFAVILAWIVPVLVLGSFVAFGVAVYLWRTRKRAPSPARTG